MLLALAMLLSGVLLWLSLKRRCIAAAQAGGDNPIPTRTPPRLQLMVPALATPKTQRDAETGISSAR